VKVTSGHKHLAVDGHAFPDRHPVLDHNVVTEHNSSLYEAVVADVAVLAKASRLLNVRESPDVSAFADCERLNDGGWVGEVTGRRHQLGDNRLMADKLVLVTGGAGFIGNHTVLLLLERGYRVRVLDALSPPVHLDHRPPQWLPSDAELQVGDVRSHSDVSKALEGVEYVVHLAAYQDYLTDFSRFFSVNTVGTALMYEVIVEQRIPIRKIVVASSQAVYGEGVYTCKEHGRTIPPPRTSANLSAGRWDVQCPICGRLMQHETTQESSVRPHNQYSLSKMTQEMVAFNLGERYSVPSTCLRYSIVQGPWQSSRNSYSGICRIFTLRALNGKRPIAFEDGQQLRDYVWVGDVARANVLALEDGRSDGQVFNVGGQSALTVSAYGEIVARELNRLDLQPETPGFYRYGDTRHIVSDSTKLQALGWSSTLTVPEIVGRYADWATSQPDAADNSDESLRRMLSSGTVRRVGD